MHVLSIFRKLNTVTVLNDAAAKIIAVFFLSKCKRHVHIHIRICCVPMLLALPVCKMVTMVAMPCQAILCLMLFGIFFSSFLLLFECVSISFFCIKRRKYKLNQLRQYLKEHDHDFFLIIIFKVLNS